ncbi:toll-like receptor 13 [Clarias magur]|uniref:Toll-like receptor 13 n=1 Tax=Clarias magur TaxID=1594786 RepID=A0A8J4TPK6_CLAMG|nr:toll-like receptor 13 [Clarias magur]
MDENIVMKCPKSNLSGFCKGVSDVALDLAGIPSHLEVLCLHLAKDLCLHPNSFSRFTKLTILQITGSISAVLPGAFKNLLGLKNLEIICLHNFKIPFSSEIFSDLLNITSVSFVNCKLSSMTTDVFKGMVKLEKLTLTNSIEDISELLCRLTFVSSSLNYLDVDVRSLVNVTTPTCAFSNGTSFDVKFHEIKNVYLQLNQVKVVNETVMKYFMKINLLAISCAGFEVLKSEFTKIDTLIIKYCDEKFSFEEICEDTYKLSTTAVTVTFPNVTHPFVPNLAKCMGLKRFGMICDTKAPAINLTFINVLRNLTALGIDWKLTPDSLHRDRALVLCENQSDLVTKLKTVNLFTNNFKRIGTRHFSCLRELEELRWTDSEIEHVEDFTFNSTSLLKALDLSRNKIFQLTNFTFFGLSNLKTLLLEENKLLMIEHLTLLPLTSVEFVNLGVFQYSSSEPSKIQINLSLPENLTKLSISSGIRPMTLNLSKSKKSQLGLSLNVYGQSVTFQDCDNTLFKSLVELTAETEQLLCGQSFPGQFLKSLRHFMIKANRKTAEMDLTDLNQLVNLKSLVLFNVDLSRQSGLDVIFRNLSNLEYLYMSFCSVPLLEKDLSRDLKSLKVMFLHADDVFSVMENFVEPLKNLRYLILKDVLLHCSCDNAWITNWAKYEKNVQVSFRDSALERLQCKTVDESTSTSTFLQKFAQENCSFNMDFLLFVSTSLGLVLFMLVVLLHQLVGDYLLAFFHIARAWVEEAMRANRKGHYHFDVFVSYSGKDERWVMDELLPNLGKRGPPSLKLCLHSRDFELGKDIVENITDSLYRSRHTLCLVSRNYLRSTWCSLEMRLATYRLLAEHRDVLVLVFLEKKNDWHQPDPTVLCSAAHNVQGTCHSPFLSFSGNPFAKKLNSPVQTMTSFKARKIGKFVSLGVFQYSSSEPSKIQINLSLPENLTKLSICSGIRPMTLNLSKSKKSQVGLSLNVYGQSVTFQDCDNTLFKSLVELTAETEQLLCGQSFPGQFLKSLRHLMIKASRKTTQMDLTDLNQLVNLKSLILLNVDLSRQSGLDVIFHNLSNLEYLYMSFCFVPLLEKDLSRDLKSLKVMFLHAGDVFSVMENFVEPLKNLRYLILNNALLHCSCDNAWITNWAKYEKNVQVSFRDSALERLSCKTVDETKSLQKYAQENCFNDVDFLLFVSTSLGLVLFMLVVLLHQLVGDYLLAFFHIARAWVEEAMRTNRKGHYHFDVFVSYSGKDERWVMDELLPNLGKRGPPSLKLCLHSRDFELGKDIVENITDSLYRSRHTLCLVSRNYLRSTWCSLEMRLATYRLLAEHKDVLVLVFLEKTLITV